jgi:hypothetical protein
MLEYMGASDWYNAQIELRDGHVLTKKGKAAHRKAISLIGDELFRC